MMTPDEFVLELECELSIKGRTLRARIHPDSVYVNFYNLPEGIGGAGGGAEAENNRMMFSVYGFKRSEGKLEIKQVVSALPKEYKLRGKTADPSVIVKYLAKFLNKVAAEVEPHFTHTKQ